MRLELSFRFEKEGFSLPLSFTYSPFLFLRVLSPLCIGPFPPIQTPKTTEDDTPKISFELNRGEDGSTHPLLEAPGTAFLELSFPPFGVCDSNVCAQERR